MYYKDKAAGPRKCSTCGRKIPAGEHCYREYDYKGVFPRYTNKCLSCAKKYFTSMIKKSQAALAFIEQRRTHGKARATYPRGKRLTVFKL